MYEDIELIANVFGGICIQSDINKPYPFVTSVDIEVLIDFELVPEEANDNLFCFSCA